MALSAAMQWALANGMTEADVYKNINDFLATNPDAATTQAQMAQYGISPQDVAAATGGKSGGMLSGNIMAGASWNSTNTALQDALTQATGQQTSNYAVGGSTTTDTLNQLNTFLAGGGQFDPNATVYLQAGGVDFIQGVDKGVVKDNLNQIVKTLGDQGVNVVLTGSPYAKSIDDVINNNFDPKVDQIFNDVAKANSNVALVGTQGEILQNKALLVDALHTNAEGTAIYNQSVIDALSQFKNEVPASTPQAIAQVQQTNTVATTPPVITQAASNPAVAQTLANTVATTPRAIPTARGTVIEGDNIEEQIAGVPQVVYETKVDPNNPANWQTVNPKTGEVIDSGTFAGGGDRGLLAAAAPVIGLAASTVGLPGITGLLGNLTGATGSTLAGLTGAAIGGGTTAIAGGTTEDILKGALLAGGASYGSSLLDNYLATGSIADPGITERQLAIADAKQLADQGLSQSQIADILGSSGYNEVMVDSAIRAATKGLTSAALPTSTATDVVNVTGTAAPAISTGGLLSSLVPTSTTTPAVTNAGTVNVTGSSTPQQVDQAVLNLINSQLASNVTTPANLANVQVTGTADKGMMSNADTTSAILNTIAGLPTTSATTPTNNLANVEVTAPTTNTGMMSSNNTANAILNALTGLPTTAAVTPTTTTPTVNVTAQTPVTTQDITTAVTSLLPTTAATQTTAATTPTVTVTAPTTPVTNQDVATIVSSLVPTATPAQSAAIAEQVITSSNPKTIQETVNAVVATLTPAVATPAATTPTVTVTAPKTTPTLSDVVAPITAALPTVTPAPVTPEVVVTAPSTPKVADVVAPIAAALPAVTTPATTTPTTTDKTNELGLTDAQMFNLLKAGIGLFGSVGAASALSGGTSSGGIGALPTQGVPLYSQDYFNQIQQNYNRILPAVPRDVASPLRDWYLSQYGA